MEEEAAADESGPVRRDFGPSVTRQDSSSPSPIFFSHRPRDPGASFLHGKKIMAGPPTSRQRPWSSGIAKRPRSAGRSQRRNNFCPVGVRGLRGRPHNNVVTRRRHRRDHRLIVGSLRIRKHSGLLYCWAPLSSLLDRKRTAVSVAQQADRRHPTTQRLRPPRRRRRRRCP